MTSGCRLLLHYALATTDGLTVIATDPKQPEWLTPGQGMLPQPLEELLLDLEIGEEYRFEVSGQQLFGPYDNTKLHRLPKADLPGDWCLQDGQVVLFSLPDDEIPLPGTILLQNNDHLLVDFNPPLINHSLIFRVHLLAIADEPLPP